MSIRRPRPVVPPQSALARFRFLPDVIVLAVRWHLRFGLSYRDVNQLLTGRGVEVDHVTIYRWVVGSQRQPAATVPDVSIPPDLGVVDR